MGEAKRRQQFKGFQPKKKNKLTPSWNGSDGSNTDNHVQAIDLQHIVIREPIHLWQLKNGVCKSLTNSCNLYNLEHMKGYEFNEIKFWQLMRQQTGLANGFYFANHFTRKAGFIPGDNWTQEIEKILIDMDIAKLI